MNKLLVGKRFEKAAISYNEAAIAQAYIAESLWRLIQPHLPDTPISILEIGCGTGLLTKQYINLSGCSFTVNDLYNSESYLPQDYPISFIPGDAENIDWDKDKWSLILSASTVQWFTDITGFIKRIANSITKDGIFAFSTFGDNNYQEFNTLDYKGLNYLSIEQIKQAIGSEFEILHMSEELIELEFDSVKDIFRHIKATGVSGCNTKRLTPGELKELESKYHSMWTKQNGKLSLTYHPIFVILRKKPD